MTRPWRRLSATAGSTAKPAAATRQPTGNDPRGQEAVAGRDTSRSVALGGVELDRYSFGALTLTSHVTPNLSVHIPNVSPQTAFSSGISTVPLADSLSKYS